MASARPPAKRQRRLVVLSSDEENEDQPQVNTRSGNKEFAEELGSPPSPSTSFSATRQVALSSLPSRTKLSTSPPKRPSNQTRDKTHRTAARTKSPSASPAKKRTKKETNSRTDESPSKAKSLHSFFQPATEEQRWSKHKFNPKTVSAQASVNDDIEDEELDLIEDFEDDEDEDFNNIFTQYIAKEHARTEQRGVTANEKVALEKDAPSRSTRRFLLSTDTNGGRSDDVLHADLASSADTLRPWSERYAPCNLEELAVHKKKVADVRNWLTEAFSGKSKRNLLVLRGPAGSGKTTTLSLLSIVLGFELVEWRNPLGTGSVSQEHISQSAQFEDFLGRSRIFGTLRLDGVSEADKHPQRSLEASSRRVILVEEFPTSLSRASSAVSAFRTSLHRCLASDQTFFGRRPNNASPPVVVILSETLLGTTSAMSDNITVHRLLGPEICHHPGTTIMEFNSIAPTFMHKALDLVLKKEARNSQRKRIPGPAVLKSLSEMGDIRSAISSLEFMCLRGDNNADWGGRVAARLKSIHRNGTPLTAMEKDTLQLVTQREASLGIFHAVGKVVYNKRDRIEAEANGSNEFVAPPEHLRHLQRPGGSQVSLESLISEIGTDISTFISALHENYIPSCDGNNFTDCVDGCAETLSDSDILGPNARNNLQGTRSGIGAARNPHQGYGSSVDMLRQDEIAFQIAVRGLLFNLPYPVKRRIGPTGSGGRTGDAYKMFFPTSLRLWKESEEVQGLVDLWARRSLFPEAFLAEHDRNPTVNTENQGVSSWKTREVDVGPQSEEATNDAGNVVSTMLSRHELLLHVLPYLFRLRGGKTDRRELERVTQFRGIGGPNEQVFDEANDDNDPVTLNDWSTDQDFPLPRTRVPRLVPREAHTRIPNLGLNQPSQVEAAVEKLLLSDDEIEDD